VDKLRAIGKEERKTENVICKIEPSLKTRFYEKCRKELGQSPSEIVRGLIEKFNRNSNLQIS
jgi:hypothetical protein